MTAAQRDQLCKFIHNAITRTTGRSVEVQTEVVADRVELWLDMNSLAEGIGVISEPPDTPINFPLVDMRAIERAEPAKPGLVVLAKSMNEIKEAAAESSPISPILLSKVGPPARTRVKPKKHWDDSDLIQAIVNSTPPKIRFTPNHMNEGVKLTASRNVKSIAGADVVRLEYSVGGINETEGGVVAPDSGGVPDTPVSIGLTANRTFSMWDEVQDFQEAIQGERGIVEQLKGLYAPRSERMTPVAGPDPGPLRFDESLPMRDSYASQLSPGVNPGDPLAKFKRSQVEANRGTGTLEV
jgi:hypothetical protein